MKRKPIRCDLECYKDFFLAKFYDGSEKRFFQTGAWPGQELDIESLIYILKNFTLVTFNGNGYDLPMLILAINGLNTDQLKEASDDIIVRQMRPWQLLRKWGVFEPNYIDHIDIMEVAPGVKMGLKAYMARMHAPTIQDLPYEPSFIPGAPERFNLSEYCGNDLIGTDLLAEEIADRLRLRESISATYGIDVRSKSDAQIAEAVIKAQLTFDPVKRFVPHGYQFNYVAPDFIQFVSPEMQRLLRDVCTAPFVVTDKEQALEIFGDSTGIRTGVNIPDILKDRDIRIGNGVYRMGIGGLHSQESSVSYYADDSCTIRDIDVKSYYPSLILLMRMFPEQIGPAFITIFQKIYDKRLFAKGEAERIMKLFECMGAAELKLEAEHFQTESDGLKIVLNGTFGKLFSKWSILYAPELGIRTTITGQLALLMLIEMLERCGIQVISANTDGIVLKIPRGLESTADYIVKWWEGRTGLEMEAKDYRSIHFRDVNNYVAITTDGKTKRKGVFNQSGVLSGPQGKTPFMDICADAVVAYLKDGTPIEKTISDCKDIRKFIVARSVTGGGEYISANRREYLGKVVRWYYSRNVGYIAATKSGNKVASSDMATPVMRLPATMPDDVDLARYDRAAYEMLADVGIPVYYWYHPESDCVLITLTDDCYEAALCDQIDRKTYDKRKG